MRISWLLASLLMVPIALSAAVIGANTPALPITAERIAALPLARQAAWKAYLDQSRRQMRADQAFLQAEVRSAGLEAAMEPPAGSAARSLPLNQPAGWYGSAEARRTADIVVTFQTPAGGWSKNLNLSDHARRKGEHFAPDNLSLFPGGDDFDTPAASQWHYVGTLDNDATTSELQYLARVVAAPGATEGAAYRKAFLHGLDYLLASQFPNGGWPQVWPLEGGYHDAITFNDGAITHVLSLLRDVSTGKAPFQFVSAGVRRRAASAVTRGIDCILATQIRERGTATVWGQQHDPFGLQPVGARNYEPPSQCSSESAALLRFLMETPTPGARLVAAVHAAAAWFRKSAISGMLYARGVDGGYLKPAENAKPIWARFYEIGSGRPIFGDRDKSIHDTLDEISRERRSGVQLVQLRAAGSLGPLCRVEPRASSVSGPFVGACAMVYTRRDVPRPQVLSRHLSGRLRRLLTPLMGQRCTLDPDAFRQFRNLQHGQ